MATRISSLCRLNMGMANLLLRNNIRNGIRTVYTEQALGLDVYERLRNNFRNQFTNVDGLFRKKMEEVCQDDTSMVFTEDLKAMLHLVQKRPEDLQLLQKMLSKFNTQSKEMRFGTYIFGPVVMRAFYYLDEPDEALKAFTDPVMGSFFHQFTTYKILLTLLYRHGRYNDMRTVYSQIKANASMENGSPRQSLLLLMAACYKQNTKESYDYAMEIWKDFVDDIKFLPLRAVFLFACMNLNNDAPHLAVELVSVIRDQRHIAARNIKVLAFAQLKRFEEIVPIFKQSLDARADQMRDDYFHDVISKLQTILQENDGHIDELKKLLQQIEANGMVISTSLDDYLTRPISGARRFLNDANREYQNYNRGGGFDRNTGSDRISGYDRNYGHDRNSGYDRNPGYDRQYGDERNMGGYNRNDYNSGYQNNMGQRRRNQGGNDDFRRNKSGMRDMA